MALPNNESNNVDYESLCEDLQKQLSEAENLSKIQLEAEKRWCDKYTKLRDFIIQKKANGWYMGGIEKLLEEK